MELRHLRYFLAVADAEHFTRAAEALHVSQPALSQQIRQLERELSVPLFDRLGRRVRLTAAGVSFQGAARRIVRELQEARNALADLSEARRGEVRVGAVQTVNSYLIPSVVTAFRGAYPGVALRVEELSADQIEAGLLGGRLDVGIGFLPPRDARISGDPLFAEDLVLLTSARHPWSRRRRVATAELDGQPLILLPPTFCTRRLIDHSLKSAGARVDVLVEMDSIEGILATVRSTGAATILPALVGEEARRYGLTTIRLSDPAPRRTVGLLWLHDAHRSIAAEAFGDATARAARERVPRLRPAAR